jgi:hypothetical protein
MVEVAPIEGSPGEFAVYANLSALEQGDYDVIVTLERGVDVSKVVGDSVYFTDHQGLAVVHGRVRIGTPDLSPIAPAAGIDDDPIVAPVEPVEPLIPPPPSEPEEIDTPAPTTAVRSDLFADQSQEHSGASLLDLKDDDLFAAPDDVI